MTKPQNRFFLRTTWIVTAAVAMAAAVTLSTLLAPSDRPRSRSEKSFDEIYRMVVGQASGEVVRLLGEPDSRQPIFGADEKWIWWNYTYLDGNDYPPELRGRVVHLEIIFRNQGPISEELWRVDGKLAVRYRLPAVDHGA